MSLFKFNPIDPDDYDEVKVTLEKKRALTKDDMISSGEREINPMLFLGFHLHEVYQKYALDLEVIFTLLYLKELGVFPYRLENWRGAIKLQRYLNIGLVTRVPYKIDGRKQYTLSPYGDEIVKYFLDSIKKNDRFVSAVGQTDAQRAVMDALNDYFN